MKKSRMSGAWWPTFWMIILLCLGSINIINFLLGNNEENVRWHLDNNEVYTSQDEDDIALKILDIAATNIRVDNQLFYVVETDNAIVLLESYKRDEDLKNILDNKDKLSDGSYYLAVERVPESERVGGGRYSSKRTFHNITPKFIEDIIKDVTLNLEFKNMIETKKPLITKEYLSLARYKQSAYFGFGFGIFLIIIGLSIACSVCYKIKRNLKEYRELDEAFPELRGDFSSIKTDAEYIDEKLKFLVYKGALIIYYKGFSITKFEDINAIRLYEVSSKRRYTYNIKLTYLEGEREEWRIRKYKKETMNRIEKFKEYMLKKHPKIKVIIYRV